MCLAIFLEAEPLRAGRYRTVAAAGAGKFDIIDVTSVVFA